MTTAIFVAGIRGVGKSTLLETYADRAITIEAEAVQAEAVKIAKGDDYSSQYEWKIWDDELKTRATELLRDALKTVYPDLEPSNKPLLIVGALLIKDWFRRSFIDVIQDKFPSQATNPVFFVLHLDEQIISNQIEKRDRPHEAEFVNNFEKIRNERDGYWNLASFEWQKIVSHENLHVALGAHI
ncbi:hypothetical protein [Noviherbaspirillum soli]|uniref:hypothetical protein n=1 Tax=Noviherbaspirillum soli TaxID=1064518 RepID=UPI00188B9DFA|nr:hypothetical protein [Noviherbaspirillum soli]